MSLAVALYTAALALPPPYRLHEQPSERAERLAVIALALAEETRDADDWTPGWSREDWAWLAFSKLWHESGRFDVKVHDGRRRGSAGEACLGQIMTGGGPLVGTGYDETRACVRESLRILALHASRCQVGPATRTAATRVMAGYGTGYSCSATMRWTQSRAWLWAKLREKHAH